MSERHNVLLTGAASGLGKAMAAALLKAGHRVVLHDRPGEAAERMRADAAPFGDAASIAIADLSESQQVERLATDAVSQAGRIDVLINNAGVSANFVRTNFLLDPLRFWELSSEQTQAFFQINSIAPYVLSARLCRPMVERGWGRIVNITTGLGVMLRQPGYGGSKAGLEAHSAVMAKHLEGTGVSVNVLVPAGVAHTAQVCAEENKIDLARLVSPDVMAPAILWLASSASDGANGMRFEAETADTVPYQRPGKPIGWPGLGA